MRRPVGRYPDPSAVGGLATDSRSAARRGLPNWAWAAIAVGLTLVVVIVVAVVVLDSGPSYPGVASAPSLARNASARSDLLPEMQLPPGTTRVGHDPTGPSEFWTVPLPYADTVEKVRPELPIGRSYRGLAWCTEFTKGELTIWSWGDETDYLSVTVDPATERNGSEVAVAREASASGCQR